MIGALDPQKIPRHVAIIMDGNGRWAQGKGLPRTVGHKHGAETVRTVVEAAADFGISYLTLFGFSSENWSRPPQEVQELMRLLRYYLRAETAELHKNGIKLRVIGNRAGFDKDIVELIENAEKLTEDNERLTVMIALNYGGRHDILQAASSLAQTHGAKLKQYSEEQIESLFSDQLMTAGVPDPDLLIRTSGEQRISNFLLWQCAYAEIIFTPVFWPDFGRKELAEAIENFAGRERRYGRIKVSK